MDWRNKRSAINVVSPVQPLPDHIWGVVLSRRYEQFLSNSLFAFISNKGYVRPFPDAIQESTNSMRKKNGYSQMSQADLE